MTITFKKQSTQKLGEREREREKDKETDRQTDKVWRERETKCERQSDKEITLPLATSSDYLDSQTHEENSTEIHCMVGKRETNWANKK